MIRCERAGKEYYTLPGGGQDPQESLEQTVVRECLEETGFTVKVGSLAFVLEEIITDPQSIAQYPDYCHHHMWYFRCELAENAQQEITHLDLGQTGICWIPLEEVKQIPLVPQLVRDSIAAAFKNNDTRYLGTTYYEKPVIPG